VSLWQIACPQRNLIDRPNASKNRLDSEGDG
jgi:hypothetical protein